MGDSELLNVNSILENNEKVAILYTAVWCGPCKQIYPIFESLQQQYTNILFVKVDVDKYPVESISVDTIPCVRFFYKNKVVSEVVGSHPEVLVVQTEKFQQYSN